MLSPTLPTAIEEELEKLRAEDKLSYSSATSSAEKPGRKALSDVDLAAKKVAVSPKQSEAAASRLGDLGDRKRKLDEASARLGDAHDLARPEYGSDLVRPAKRQRFIVKLKYGRRHRKRVEQILKLPSRTARASHHHHQRNASENGVTPRPNGAVSPGAEDASKKVRADAANHLSATPRKDLKAIQMQRSESTESATKTPHRPGGTPQPPRPSSSNSSKSAEADQWGAISKKYNDLGRTLKHKLRPANSLSDLGSGERKRNVALNLQCLLSYVLAFHCADVAARLSKHPPSLTQTWLSLIALWKEMGRACAPYPHLDGLRHYLGIVIRNAIASNAAERISVASGPLSSSAPAAPPTLEVMRENALEMALCAHAAAVKLGTSALAASFPATWKDAGPDVDRPPPGALDRDVEALLRGRYWLPFAADTTPVQGVRFGLRLLGEWMGREGVEMEAQLRA